jgi:hypothetical protein
MDEFSRLLEQTASLGCNRVDDEEADEEAEEEEVDDEDSESGEENVQVVKLNSTDELALLSNFVFSEHEFRSSSKSSSRIQNDVKSANAAQAKRLREYERRIELLEKERNQLKRAYEEKNTQLTVKEAKLVREASLKKPSLEKIRQQQKQLQAEKNTLEKERAKFAKERAKTPVLVSARGKYYCNNPNCHPGSDVRAHCRKTHGAKPVKNITKKQKCALCWKVNSIEVFRIGHTCPLKMPCLPPQPPQFTFNL